MSTRFGNGEGTVPVERTAQRAIATFTNYSEAERAIDRLSDEGFAVERTMLVGRNLRYAERVTGRFGWVDALAGGRCRGRWSAFWSGGCSPSSIGLTRRLPGAG